MRHVKGNILDSDADAILHQVNCQGVMGAGLAKQIRDRYPNVYEKYKNACMNDKKDCQRIASTHSMLLGKIQVVHKKDYLVGDPNMDQQVIVNVFAQEFYGRDRRYTDYDALQSCLHKVNERFAGKTVAIPYLMGCGLAGGSWDVVLSIIAAELSDCDVIIYEYTP